MINVEVAWFLGQCIMLVLGFYAYTVVFVYGVSYVFYPCYRELWRWILQAFCRRRDVKKAIFWRGVAECMAVVLAALLYFSPLVYFWQPIYTHFWLPIQTELQKGEPIYEDGRVILF